MIKLRYRLAPYIYTYFREGCETGIPLMRPMWMEFSEDDECYKSEVFDYQFMFGPHLLVAPVVDQGETTKAVYLPEGTWYEFSSRKNYQGGQNIVVDAPLDHINVFVKEGSFIPVYKHPSINMTKTRTSGLEYLKFGKNAEGKIYIDDGHTFSYRKGQYGLYHISPDLDLTLVEGNGFEIL